MDGIAYRIERLDVVRTTRREAKTTVRVVERVEEIMVKELVR
jgi:hypothetical protein